MQKITFTAKSITSTLPNCAAIANAKGKQEVFDFVLIKFMPSKNTAFAIASNGHQFVTKRIDTLSIESESLTDYSVLLDSKRLLKILDGYKHLKPDSKVTLVVDTATNIATFKAGRSKLKIVTRKPCDYPDLPKVNDHVSGFSMNSMALIQHLRSCRHAIPKSNFTSSVVSGLSMSVNNGVVTFVSTDGHRILRSISTPLNVECESISVIIPLSSIDQICQVAAESSEVQIKINEQMIQFTNISSQIRTQLIDAKFSNINPIYDAKINHNFTVNRNEILQSLNRLKSTVSMTQAAVEMEVKNSELLLTTPDGQLVSGEDAIETINVAPSTKKLSVNINYITDALNSFDSSTEQVAFGVSELKGLISITAGGVQRQALICPMSL